MVHTQALNLLPRTFPSTPLVELQRSFPSQIQTISPCVDQFMRLILNFRNGHGSVIDIENPSQCELPHIAITTFISELVNCQPRRLQIRLTVAYGGGRAYILGRAGVRE
jgi:hypothetical protein